MENVKPVAEPPGVLVDEKDTSVNSTETSKTIITFQKDDPENPYNWSRNKKLFILFTATMTLFNGTLASSLPANVTAPMSAAYGVDNTQGNPELALPISLFLVGYLFGPLVFGPLSELEGRRYVVQTAFAGYTIFTLACALAPNWASMLVFRLMAGIFASAPTAIGGGIMADIYADLTTRGRALTCFYSVSICGPLIAPTIAGYVSEVSWRWAFWVGLIVAGATIPPLAFLPETFGPTILARRAKKIRKDAQKTGSANGETYAAIELEAKGWRNLMSVVLVRPIHMLFTELIVAASSLYIALAYSIYYMFFQTYPIVFKGIYGMSTKISGFMYFPIAGGVFLGMAIFLLWDAYYTRCKKAGRAWAQKTEFSRLPLACIGGPLLVISLFWLGWTARPSISWISPMMAGVPFGAAQILISMSLTNYLGDCYGVYSASAMAIGSCLRNLAAAGLCLAAAPMYTALNVGWATTVLGIVSVFMCAIPFVFIRYGEYIREKSLFYQKLKKDEAISRGDLESDGDEAERNIR
ncbi:hypothetical protein NW768_002531 [Fusarium equiseti]|uniref:Major facilitator superfamily (MFS) profile domain-containing protein n=1 Tax=Fusarium equiseti TaxID=61235 RepID=A0ABQ8RP57_FUSEQ|nr:hypothetical protein NW768_002531 [Fusarium equiseti]